MGEVNLILKNGWVKLPRAVENFPFWKEKPFSKGHAFADLLLLSEYRNEKTSKSRIITKSQNYLSNRWGWDKRKTARFLKELEKQGFISISSTNQGSQIVIYHLTSNDSSGQAFQDDSHGKNSHCPANGTANGTVQPVENTCFEVCHGTANGTADGTAVFIDGTAQPIENTGFGTCHGTMHYKKNEIYIYCASDDAQHELSSSSERTRRDLGRQRQQEADALFEKLWKLYPSKKGKAKVSQTQKAKLLSIGEDHMMRALNRYLEGLKREEWRSPQNGSTFFNSGYVDYLDDNYEQPQQTKPTHTDYTSRF